MYFFSCSPFGSHERSFDPLVLVMGTFSFHIVTFLETASLEASFFCIVILAFSLDEYSTSAGPFDASNFNFAFSNQILDFVLEVCAIFY